MNLTGKTILITGGSTGIGLALAEEFVRRGNKVIITGRSETKLQSAKQKCPELTTYTSDVANPENIQRTAQTVISDHPNLNMLINNAGIMKFTNLTGSSTDLTKLTEEIDVNVHGAIRTTSAYIDILKKNQGTVMNVSSGLAFVPMMSAPIYCCTKAALHSFSVGLRFQLKEVGVRVVELAPPAVKTELTKELPEDGEFKMLTTDELVAQTMTGLEKDKDLITPGQSSQLRFMSRLAPGFIEEQLAKGSRPFLPAEVS